MTGTAQPEIRGLLDTSVVVMLGRLDPRQLPEIPLISTITLAELAVGPLVTDDPSERAARQAHLQRAEADFVPLAFDHAAAVAFGGVAASLRARGRKSAARAYDALIAAVAVANGLPLYTCNPSDVEGVDVLDVRPVTPPA